MTSRSLEPKHSRLTFAHYTSKRRQLLPYAIFLVLSLLRCNLPTGLFVPQNLDTTFGDGGIVRTDLGGSGAYAVLLQSDGKIVAVGNKWRDSSTKALALARYNSDGALDRTFGSESIVITGIGDTISPVAGLILPDSKIVALGSVGRDVTIWNVALARYNTDGSLDPAFGQGGKVITYMEGRDQAIDFALQPDGKIIVLAKINQKDGIIPVTTVLIRYNSDGSIDQTFGDHGKSY